MNRIVYVANKSSWGAEFAGVYNSLEELKRAIVNHSLSMYVPEDHIVYSESLAKRIIEEDLYTLYEVNLHEDEHIVFDDYDGQSWFTIEKIDKNIFSTSQVIEN
jgi:hypothetical protein